KTERPSAPLNHFKKQRGAREYALGEQLEQIPVVIAIDEDLQLPQFFLVLLNLADTLVKTFVVIAVRDFEKLLTHPPHLGDGRYNVGCQQRNVLHSGSIIAIEELLDLRVLRGRFINGQLHPSVGRAYHLGHQCAAACINVEVHEEVEAEDLFI